MDFVFPLMMIAIPTNYWITYHCIVVWNPLHHSNKMRMQNNSGILSLYCSYLYSMLIHYERRSCRLCSLSQKALQRLKSARCIFGLQLRHGDNLLWLHYYVHVYNNHNYICPGMYLSSIKSSLSLSLDFLIKSLFPNHQHYHVIITAL